MCLSPVYRAPVPFTVPYSVPQHSVWMVRAPLLYVSPVPLPPVAHTVPQQSVRMYEPQAADLLMKLGLSVAEHASPSPEGTGGVTADRIVPLEGVQALSAAMSLIGGESGVSAEVCVVFFFVVSEDGVVLWLLLRRAEQSVVVYSLAWFFCLCYR